MSISKKQPIPKNLKLQLTIQQLKSLLYKYGVVASLEQLYVDVFGSNVNADNEDDDYIAAYIYNKIFRNLYRLTKRNKIQCDLFISNMALNAKIPKKKAAKIYCEYVSYIYSDPKYAAKNLFSHFHLLDMQELLLNYSVFEQAIQTANTYRDWRKYYNKLNMYENIICMKKVVRFAQQLDIKPLRIKQWLRIILYFLKDKRYPVDKFIKYVDFSEFNKYIQDHDLINVYYAEISK